MKNHNGILPFYRRDFVTFKDLSPQELKLRWGIICLMAWDGNNHPTKYGIFKGSQKQIAEYIGEPEPFVSKHLTALLTRNPGFKKVGSEYIADDFDAFTYGVACKREKLIREQEKANEKLELSKRKAEVARSQERIANQKDTQVFDADRTTSRNSSLVSFNSYLVSSNHVRHTPEYWEEKKRGWINDGLHDERSLTGLCFCGSGLPIVECCAEAVAESLR